MAVEASVVIDFADEDADDVSGIITVELDEEHSNNLDAEGQLKSSFSPDDVPVFLIHHEPSIEVLDVKCTDGRVSSEGVNQTRTRTLDGLFTKEGTTISMSYYGVTSVDAEWYGNVGDVYINDDGELTTNASSSVYPCSCTTTYEVLFNEQWSLTPPSLDLEEDETYTIHVVVYVREVIL